MFIRRLLPFLLCFLPVLPVTLRAVPPDIPRLDWQPRSDWINVKTGVSPGATGDGRADDTVALQAALDRGVWSKS